MCTDSASVATGWSLQIIYPGCNKVTDCRVYMDMKTFSKQHSKNHSKNWGKANAWLKHRSDADLVLAIQTGDSGYALEELAKRHYDYCLGRARSILRERADAEDAVQDAWIKACLNLDKLSDGDRFAGWLDRIVVTTCIDSLRKQKSQQTRTDTSEELSALATAEASPQQVTLSAETERVVRVAVSQLPVKYREPLRRFHLLGESYRNIAAVLGVPVGTVQSHIARARKRLEIMLEPYSRTAFYCL